MDNWSRNSGGGGCGASARARRRSATSAWVRPSSRHFAMNAALSASEKAHAWH